MSKAKKLILAVMCGLPADSKIVKDALSDPSTAQELLAGTALTKADILTVAEGEDAFLSHAQAWDNLPQIATILRAQGEELTAADLNATHGGTTAPARYAERLGKLDKLLTPEVWQGRVKDMDRFFYTLAKTEREKLGYTELRRAVAAVDAVLTPEDTLRSYGLEPLTVRANLFRGELADLKTKLAENGDHIRKEYLFLLDSDGDNMFEFSSAFDNMDGWLAELEAHGERLGKDDVLFAMDGRKSILDYAVKHDKLPKIFRARIWNGQAAEMMDVYNRLETADRAKVDINAVLSELKEAEYGDLVRTDTLGDLTCVLNEHERGDEGFFPVHPLGFEKVWKDMANIRATLAAQGERITLDHLRQPAGRSGDSVLMLAARNGHFDQVMAIAADSRQTLTLDELTTAGPTGKSLLNVLVEKGEVAKVFSPEQWVGRGRELVTLWNAVPTDKRADIDFETLSGRVNVLTLRQRAMGGPRLGI